MHSTCMLQDMFEASGHHVPRGLRLDFPARLGCGKWSGGHSEPGYAYTWHDGILVFATVVILNDQCLSGIVRSA